MAQNPIRSPEHWLQRAKDAWHHVENMRDPDSRLQMIEIAEGYERMAQRARERRQRGDNLIGPDWAPYVDAKGQGGNTRS
jgi:hypothetical protein